MTIEQYAPAALDEADVGEFRARLRGELLRPGDAGYDTARRIYNALIDKRPALIARCVDVADVINAVNFAREQALTVSVRGGGHNVAGFAVNDGGLVIDLALLKGIHVDPLQRVARADGGVTWGDLDHATHAFGLATPGGVLSTTGIAGLTLGGGIGHLTRAYSLSCDNLLAADVVTADGRFVTASADEHADLFWGLRGGGGNFGVVTSFAFRLHPVDTVLGGPLLWPAERSTEVLRFYRDYIAQAPDEMSAIFAFLIVPPGPPFPAHLHGQTMCGIVACYAGPPEQGEAAVRPLREFGPPAVDLLGPLPYPALQGMFDALLPPGLCHYWKADFMTELSDEAIAAHVRYGPGVPTVQSGMHLYPLGRAVQRVGSAESAFSYREAQFAHIVFAVDPDPARMLPYVDWVRAYWAALHPYSAGGAYVNFLMDEGEDRIKATYRDNYARLVALKNAYDPTNLLHANQNIKPSTR